MTIRTATEHESTPTDDRLVPSAEEPPRPSDGAPRTSTGRRRLRAVRTFVVVVVLLAGAAVGGTKIARDRLAAQAFVDLGTAVLTAEAVPVGSADAGVVADVMVSQETEVTAGQPVATLRLTASEAAGRAQTSVLRAPTAGTVSAVHVVVGGVARAGEPVVTLYDKAKLTFQASVPVEELRRLRLGMTAYITGPGLASRIEATLDHVVPRVGTDPLTASDRLTVVLDPEETDMSTVSQLIPGLRFKATVDTKTAVGATPAVNSGG